MEVENAKLALVNEIFDTQRTRIPSDSNKEGKPRNDLIAILDVVGLNPAANDVIGLSKFTQMCANDNVLTVKFKAYRKNPMTGDIQFHYKEIPNLCAIHVLENAVVGASKTIRGGYHLYVIGKIPVGDPLSDFIPRSDAYDSSYYVSLNWRALKIPGYSREFDKYLISGNTIFLSLLNNDYTAMDEMTTAVTGLPNFLLRNMAFKTARIRAVRSMVTGSSAVRMSVISNFYTMGHKINEHCLNTDVSLNCLDVNIALKNLLKEVNCHRELLKCYDAVRMFANDSISAFCSFTTEELEVRQKETDDYFNKLAPVIKKYGLKGVTSLIFPEDTTPQSMLYHKRQYMIAHCKDKIASVERTIFRLYKVAYLNFLKLYKSEHTLLQTSLKTLYGLMDDNPDGNWDETAFEMDLESLNETYDFFKRSLFLNGTFFRNMTEINEVFTRYGIDMLNNNISLMAEKFKNDATHTAMLEESTPVFLKMLGDTSAELSDNDIQKLAEELAQFKTTSSDIKTDDIVSFKASGIVITPYLYNDVVHLGSRLTFTDNKSDDIHSIKGGRVTNKIAMLVRNSLLGTSNVRPYESHVYDFSAIANIGEYIPTHKLLDKLPMDVYSDVFYYGNLQKLLYPLMLFVMFADRTVHINEIEALLKYIKK